MAEVIRLVDIVKSYIMGDSVVHALDHVNVQIGEGEFTSIMGPSGSGKSKMMNILGCLDRPTSGHYFLRGRDIAGYNDDELAHTRNAEIGFVFQNFNLFPHWNVLRNITEAPVCIAKVPPEQAKEEAMELLKKLGLETKADAYPHQLSGGQAQRVAIARALALKPKILFFDEPTSALDPELTGEVLKVIRSLADLHMTMVIVTHEMLFAKEISDRIVFMDKGVIVEDCPPEEMFHSENPRVREFLGKYGNVS